ncbi:MAG: hypothetical protein ACI9OT_001082 [Gammaproteobacteria bacterium]|jgi:hypothetical protein
MTVITYSWQTGETDWGKRLSIFYDKTDSLVNCVSFGLFSSPSPFHWSANRRKVNKLKNEIENGINNILKHSV